MRVMEMQWEWYEGKKREAGSYLPKDEALAIAHYAKQFGKFPQAGISRNQRRNIRKNYGIPESVR